MTALNEWTNLFPTNTGLTMVVWISSEGTVTTDPYRPQAEPTSDVAAWINLNRDALLAYWRGDIDGWEMVLRAKRLPGAA